MDRQSRCFGQYGRPYLVRPVNLPQRNPYEGAPIVLQGNAASYSQPIHQSRRRNSFDSGIQSYYSRPASVMSRTTSVSETIQQEQIQIDLDMSVWDFYDKVRQKTLSCEKMRLNGYPMMGAENVVVIHPTKYEKDKHIWALTDDRECLRCHKMFSFHDMQGCDSHVHVTNQMPISVKSEFVETPPALSKHDPRSNKVYAVDCEMVYTMNGLELARFTMTNFNDEVELDLYVKPAGAILDLNTQHSGITMLDLEKTVETLETCRHQLFQFINSETILVGHSLESDLKALRLVHPNVVDTAIIFAENGRKQRLCHLSEHFLRRTIQLPGDGHNSKEDSQTTYNLLKYFISKQLFSSS
ncbi:unnamed protein product [Caenorhabditis angaria]|uniref:Exonuclease domain-containing protein n=1 Tax=Caenorhabditis angaria TaxID=860376 RepID=A0A9P1NBB8_9PELO|nr:unnamed protein product [Caenorhabditis angaria]